MASQVFSGAAASAAIAANMTPTEAAGEGVPREILERATSIEQGHLPQAREGPADAAATVCRAPISQAPADLDPISAMTMAPSWTLMD